MAASFTVLASGSSGNAAFVHDDGFGLLIDCGIGVRTTAGRLARAGFSWNDVHAVVLTHTHGDHWNETALAHIARRGIPMYCHRSHAESLAGESAAFRDVLSNRCVECFSERPFAPGGSISLLSLALSHDSHRTFGFRIERTRGASWAIGYAADLGCFDEAVIDALTDVDVLAVEFNHDVPMQVTSGRPAMLVERVLGSRGHLSNHQGGELVGRVLRQSRFVKPRFLVPLHLSRQCNCPSLAEDAARAALCQAGHDAEIVMTQQSSASLTVSLTAERSLFDGRSESESLAQSADA